MDANITPHDIGGRLFEYIIGDLHTQSGRFEVQILKQANNSYRLSKIDLSSITTDIVSVPYISKAINSNITDLRNSATYTTNIKPEY